MSEIQPIQGNVPIIGDGWVQLGGTESGVKIHWDKLSKAEQDLVIEYMLSSQFPVLAPPQDTLLTTSNVSGISPLQIDQARHDILTSMLDGWLKSIRLQAELSKQADERRTIERLDGTYRTYQHSVNSQQDPLFPLFAVGMIIVGTGIHQSLLPSVADGSVPFNPVANMADKTLVPVMGDMRAELGLIGAIYAAGLQYFTVAQIASIAVNKGQPGENAFAQGYAKNVVSLINSPTFNSYLLAIVTNGMKRGEIHDRTIGELAAMVKVILLSSALTMLYKTEAGKMLSEEFAGMINGTISFKRGDIRNTLLEMINHNLRAMSGSLRERVLASLLEYLDTDPSIESLSDPAKVFTGLYATLPPADLAG